MREGQSKYGQASAPQNARKGSDKKKRHTVGMHFPTNNPKKSPSLLNAGETVDFMATLHAKFQSEINFLKVAKFSFYADNRLKRFVFNKVGIIARQDRFSTPNLLVLLAEIKT